MADFGESLPIDALLFDGSPAASVHNRFPVLWQQLNAGALLANRH
jgi:alpha-glucosidase